LRVVNNYCLLVKVVSLCDVGDYVDYYVVNLTKREGFVLNMKK